MVLVMHVLSIPYYAIVNNNNNNKNSFPLRPIRNHTNLRTHSTRRSYRNALLYRTEYPASMHADENPMHADTHYSHTAGLIHKMKIKMYVSGIQIGALALHENGHNSREYGERNREQRTEEA